MTCFTGRMGNDFVHICMPDIFRIRTAAGEFCFEYHKFCGPTLLGEDGNPIHLPDEEDHPFWLSLSAWIQHGRRVDAEGFCILEAPGATD